MTDVGNRLRRAREQAGLDIQDISAATKIKPRFLHAIERGEFETLPGHFFARNFLKAYAREVGVSTDEVAADFDEGFRAVEVAPAPPLPKSPIRSTALRFPRDPERPLTRGVWPVAALGALLLIVGYGADPEPAARVEPAAVGTTGVATAGVGAVPAPQPERVPETLSLDIRPTEQIWVAATADGERVVYRLLEPGERVKVEARREMSFRIGNAAAFQYAINGVPGKPLGGAGEVREFQITGENYRTYRR